MAEIEETEHGDEGRVREWMGRAMRASGDPVWTADGVVSERWLPVSPNGRLDGFVWKLPLAEIGVTRPVIEVAPPPPPRRADRGAARAGSAAGSASRAGPPPRKSAKSRPKPAAKPKPVEPVIPLVHAPGRSGPGFRPGERSGAGTHVAAGRATPGSASCSYSVSSLACRPAPI